MAALIHVENGRVGYREVVTRVLRYGIPRAPRGQLTRDLGMTTVVLESPYDALPIGVGRGVSVRVAAAEAVQLIGHFSDPDLVRWASPNFATYQEADGTFYGAYGKRIGLQLLHALDKLLMDHDTRQAVVTLWDPDLDNTMGKADYPCTIAFNLCIVENHLEMRTVMRSNDAWLGLPYDLFQFTQLQLTVANALGLEPGRYTHTTWSLHLYERDVAAAIDMLESEKNLEPVSLPRGFGGPGIGLDVSMMTARAVPYSGAIEMTESEKWYRDIFKDYA